MLQEMFKTSRRRPECSVEHSSFLTWLAT